MFSLGTLNERALSIANRSRMFADGVAAAGARGHVDGAAQLGEELPTLGVDQPLPMGDVG